jgi:HKD family nuclease
MAIKVTVLFDKPQTEIASLINVKIKKAIQFKIVVGFVTVEGIKALEDSISANPKGLKLLVVGAGTYRAFDALDELILYGVDEKNLFVHLGHTRLTQAGARNTFYKYHPMLHSKVIYFEAEEGKAGAFIGSHNITGFALKGLNGEAGVLLEGLITDPEFEKIRTHLEHSKKEAVRYLTDMKHAFAWWTSKFFEGLGGKTKDLPQDFEAKKTIIILCQASGDLPRPREILYFELQKAIGTINSLRAEVHVFVFDRLPQNPTIALERIDQAKRSYWCQIQGIENDKGGKELTTNWAIEDQFSPILEKVIGPFRPTPKSDMQQVRVSILYSVKGRYKYLFGKQGLDWLPELSQERKVEYDSTYSEKITPLNIVPPEKNSWFLVTGLKPAIGDFSDDSPKLLAFKAMEPESGAFVLFSTARIDLDKKEEEEKLL